MAQREKPTWWKGKLYPSRNAAAEAAGITASAVSHCILRERRFLREAGRNEEPRQEYRSTRCQPVNINGKRYPSMTAAAKAMGISPAAVSLNITRHRKGWEYDD